MLNETHGRIGGTVESRAGSEAAEKNLRELGTSSMAASTIASASFEAHQSSSMLSSRVSIRSEGPWQAHG